MASNRNTRKFLVPAPRVAPIGAVLAGLWAADLIEAARRTGAALGKALARPAKAQRCLAA